MFIRTVLFIFTLVSLAQAHGEVVVISDLRASFPEIRDQGSIGNCYAQTAADLITFDLHRSGVNLKRRFVSPLATAICANMGSYDAKLANAQESRRLRMNQTKLNSFITQMTQWAQQIKTSQDQSSSQTTRSSFDEGCKKLGYTQTECEIRFDLIDPPPAWFPKHAKLRLTSNLGEDVKGGVVVDAVIESLVNCGLCYEKKYNWMADKKFLEATQMELNEYSKPNEPQSDTTCGLETLDQKNRRELKHLYKALLKDKLDHHPAFEAIQRECKKNTTSKEIVHRVSALRVLSIKDYDATTAGETISKKLKEGTPIGVGYDATIFLGRHGPHASTLVGEIEKSGEHYYILRNSWGKDSCEDELKSSATKNFYCDRGYYIVKKELFLKNLHSYSWIDPKNKN